MSLITAIKKQAIAFPVETKVLIPGRKPPPAA